MTSTWLLWDLVVDSTSGKSGSIHVLEEPVTYVYSFCSSVILVYIGWGILKMSWEGVGVNSDFIMEMDARKCKGGREILSAGAFWGSVFNGNFLMYYKLRRGVAGVLGRLIRPEIVPVGMVFITVGIIVMPWKRRRGLARGLKEVVKTPMGRVGFRENLIGDFLTSFVKVNVGENVYRRKRSEVRFLWFPMMTRQVFFHASTRAVSVKLLTADIILSEDNLKTIDMNKCIFFDSPRHKITHRPNSLFPHSPRLLYLLLRLRRLQARPVYPLNVIPRELPSLHVLLPLVPRDDPSDLRPPPPLAPRPVRRPLLHHPLPVASPRQRRKVLLRLHSSNLRRLPRLLDEGQRRRLSLQNRMDSLLRHRDDVPVVLGRRDGLGYQEGKACVPVPQVRVRELRPHGFGVKVFVGPVSRALRRQLPFRVEYSHRHGAVLGDSGGLQEARVVPVEGGERAYFEREQL